MDDSDNFRTSVRNTIGSDAEVCEAASEAEFKALYQPRSFDLVILDMRLKKEREGLKLLREILTEDEFQPVIMVSAYGDSEAIIEAAEAGAMMFLHKQEFTPELLARMVEAVLQQARVQRQLAAARARLPGGDMPGLVSSSPAMRQVLQQIQRAAADASSTALAIGEPGSGHDLAVQAVHDRSRIRSAAPLVSFAAQAYDASAWPDALFGYAGVKGSPRRKGLLERAHEGVLHVSGLNLLDGPSRERLIEALAAGRLDVGSGKAILLDVQLVASVEPDTAAAVAEWLRPLAAGDKLIEISLPSLRDRREDIPLLAAAYLNDLRVTGQTPARSFSRAAVAALDAYPWPGNLDELRITIEYAAMGATLAGSDEIAREHLPDSVREDRNGSSGADYKLHLAKAELDLVESALKSSGAQTKSQLAERLGYTDRFALGRRVRKALSEYPALAGQFTRTAAQFRSLAENPT